MASNDVMEMARDSCMAVKSTAPMGSDRGALSTIEPFIITEYLIVVYPTMVLGRLAQANSYMVIWRLFSAHSQRGNKQGLAE
jgi:hypothetical protein